MMHITLPFWMNKGELRKLAAASQSFWEKVETWCLLSLGKFDLMTCDLIIVDYVAWERKIERLDGEDELIYRKRVDYAFVNAEDAGMTAGLYRIFERLGVSVYDIKERQPDRDWDIVTLELDPEALAGKKDLINLLIQTYGATCRRYEYNVTNKLALTNHYGQMTCQYISNVCHFYPEPPGITRQPLSHANVKQGQQYGFAVFVDGQDSDIHYQWYNSTSGNEKGPVSPDFGGNTAMMRVSTVNAGRHGYWCKIWNEAGAINSVTAYVTVVAPPTVETQPVSASLPAGETVTLTAEFNAHGSQLRWECINPDNDVVISSGIGTSARYTSEYPNQDTFPRQFVAYNEFDQMVRTDRVAVIVGPALPTIIEQPQDHPTVAIGAPYTFSIVADSGGGTLSYQWYNQYGSGGSVIDSPIPERYGGLSATMTVSTINAGTHRYWCQVTNESGSIDSDFVYVTVEQ